MSIISTDISLVRPEANRAIDVLEVVLMERFASLDCPLNHTFGDGLYIREIFMPAGAKVTSKIHKFRHPYFVMKGKARVWIDGKGWEMVTAPYFGFTEPGTRRVLDILEDCHWITVHDNPTNTEDLMEIEQRIIEGHTNQFLSPQIDEK